MNEKLENSAVFCIDMQQVQPLPTLAIGEAFYLRQLSLYNICVTDIQTKNPIFYTWCENLASRGSVEVGSALYDFLSHQSFPQNCSTFKTLRRWMYGTEQK